MRDGDVDLPDSEIAVKEISREANFYLLEGLIELCRRKLKLGTPNNWKFLESLDQVVQVTANSEKPVLIIYYNAGSDGVMWYPSDWNLTELVNKYQAHWEIYFKQGDNRGDDWTYLDFVIYHRGNTLLRNDCRWVSNSDLDSNIQKVLNEITS